MGGGLEMQTDLAIGPAGDVWVMDNWQMRDSCFQNSSHIESYSTRCGGDAVTIFFGMAKPVPSVPTFLRPFYHLTFCLGKQALLRFRPVRWGTNESFVGQQNLRLPKDHGTEAFGVGFVDIFRKSGTFRAKQGCLIGGRSHPCRFIGLTPQQIKISRAL